MINLWINRTNTTRLVLELTWYRKLIVAKFDSSKKRKKKVGRPLPDCELEGLILQISKRNPRWGYDLIVGALANLGYHISDQTDGNILNYTCTKSKAISLKVTLNGSIRCRKVSVECSHFTIDKQRKKTDETLRPISS
jgi:hypothetical protein